jgi:hypothetical protein
MAQCLISYAQGQLYLLRIMKLYHSSGRWALASHREAKGSFTGSQHARLMVDKGAQEQVFLQGFIFHFPLSNH